MKNLPDKLSNPIEQLRKDLYQSLPHELVDKLLSAYSEIKVNFYLGRHEPSELNAGKLCEVLVRIMEHLSQGTYTKFGPNTIKNVGDFARKFENHAKLPDSIRLFVSKLVQAMYDVRNRRGVGHIGGDVNPNLADATLLATVADWIMAELVRIYYRCSLEEAQKLVETLVQRRLLLVYEVGGKRRVLNPNLSFKQQVLLILANEFPKSVEDRSLFDWTEHSNFGVFKRDVLKSLHAERRIEYNSPNCIALPPGLKVVEEGYPSWSTFTRK